MSSRNQSVRRGRSLCCALRTRRLGLSPVCALPFCIADTTTRDIEVKTTIAALAAVTFLGAAACTKHNEQTTADTTTMRALDTAGGEILPTVDTVVKKQ